MLLGCSSGPTPAAVASLPVPEPERCQWAKVVRITDGDTIHVDFETGARNQVVRYVGIDTPETKKLDTPVQPFGPEAADENEDLVGGKRVCLQKDVSETDQFGRLLRLVWTEDGVFVNERLVHDGLAVLDTFPPDVKYVETFRAAQGDARTRRVGLWSKGP
jgi:micrococcal nuclease